MNADGVTYRVRVRVNPRCYLQWICSNTAVLTVSSLQLTVVVVVVVDK